MILALKITLEYMMTSLLDLFELPNVAALFLLSLPTNCYTTLKH